MAASHETWKYAEQRGHRARPAGRLAGPGGLAAIALGHAGIGMYASGERAAVQLGRHSRLAPAAGFYNAGRAGVLDANAHLYLSSADVVSIDSRISHVLPRKSS